jgi:hypothetical protein
MNSFKQIVYLVLYVGYFCCKLAEDERGLFELELEDFEIEEDDEAPF